ncbi:Ryanodine-inositol 1,4,5-triphosphate receptor Ca2 channel protein [Phytophthora megakarya]|uniref:Ryanodine-inositol 1,4,5-triphosphate receptor Ca2 channel protein n=1 Tax=Phytophthora megakarya TaxID=4795 RepID=A0A225WCH2_9STRA|nr:Ryanodine-inositol 1,4,5-triphosphate receptor Ca2 channel protein [Phytophthora megakarya]
MIQMNIDDQEQGQRPSNERKEQKEEDGDALSPLQKRRSGSMKTRPFGGKLKIDVDAAEMAAPPVIGSPLSYYASKKTPSSRYEDHPESVFTAAESQAFSGLLTASSPFLEYGMVVSLVCDDRGGLVAAEGFASRDVRLEKLNYGAETIQLRHTKSGKYVSLDPSPISFRGSEYAPALEVLAHISTCCHDLSCGQKVRPAEDGSAGQLRCRQNLFRTYRYIELLVKMIKASFQCYGGPFSIEDVCSYNDEYMNSSRDRGEDNDELELRGSTFRQRTESSTGLWIGEASSNGRGLISPRRSVSNHENTWRRKSTFGGSSTTSRLETHTAAMQSLNRIIPAINVLLLHISWANRTNELYVVKNALPVLMELLGNGFQTSLPLSYLLRENRNLVESITGYSSIIRNFFELIATRGKSIRYVQFLVALCTSRGKGVPKTQEAICELLFNPANGYRDDVVIPIRPSGNGFDICYSPDDLAFFSSLKGFCFSYLDRLQGTIVIDEIPENELTLAILRVLRIITEFGMYSTEHELSRFVAQLFDLLDERTDFVGDQAETTGNNHFKLKKTKGDNPATSLIFPSALHLRQRSASISIHPSSSPQQRNMPMVSGSSDRRSVWGAPYQPSTHLKNAVLFDGAGAMASIRITKERDASKQYHNPSRDAARTVSGDHSSITAGLECGPHRHLNKLLMHKVEMPVGNTVNVHEMNEFNRIVMEIKDEICAIFLLIGQVRVDYLISTLLASFQARHGGPTSNSPTRHRDPDVIHTALFDDAIVRETVSNAFSSPSCGLDFFPHGNYHHDKMSPLAVYLFGSKSLECKLSLTRLGDRAVTTVFMQMLMYEYPPLVSKALELLLQQFNQHDQFLKELQNVQLLVSEETIIIYNKLKGDVDELRRLAETTEVWMDLTSRSDFERAASVCQLLQSLVSVIECIKTEDAARNAEPRAAVVRRQLNLHPPGKPINDDGYSDENANSGADLFATNSICTPKEVLFSNEDASKSVQRISIDKLPPNRKLKRQTDRYTLNSSIGRVSQSSSSHEVIPPFWCSEDNSSMKDKTKDDKTIAMEARRLLRNLRAAQFVLNMLIDGAHFYEGHRLFDNDDLHSPGSPTTRSRTKLQKRQRDQIRGVFGKGMQFLRVFCCGDQENQALVAPHATMIAQYVRDLPIAQDLLAAIYADNFPLYNTVPTELINTFVGFLIHDGPDPRYLFFLETLVLCNEQPVVENQLLVLFQLVKSFENAMVLQMFDDATQSVELLGGLLRRYTDLLNGKADAYRQPKGNVPDSTSSVVGDTKIGIDSPQCGNIVDVGKILEYHVRLLHLFAACATGKNTKVQEICQQILPLMNVLDLLCHDDCTEGIHFEEFMYVIDKTVRPSMIQYETSAVTSLEQLWMMSLKYRERLDCSLLNCEQDLPELVQWALDRRDKDTINELSQDKTISAATIRDSEGNADIITSSISLPEASPSDTKDVSPLGQAIRDSTSNDSNFSSSTDTDSTIAMNKATASYKLDKLSSNKPIAWGDTGSKESSRTGKDNESMEAVETKNRGRLLHQISPRRFYRGFLSGKGRLQYVSPKKKETPVTPFFNLALPERRLSTFNLSLPERRLSFVSVGLGVVEQTDDIHIVGRQKQPFSELDQFLSWLQAHPRVHGAMRDELNQMVQGILSIESAMKEEYNPHVHVRNVMLSFDLVVAKLVEHVEALQNSTYLKTNLTLLNVFCRMIYAVEDTEQRHNMQIKLNQLGVTRLVVQLIASRDSDALFASSIEVGVALLDGMNAEVQESFYSYWSESSNENFFERIQERIEKACKLIHSVDRASVGDLSDLKKLHQRQSMFGISPNIPSGDKLTAGERGGSKLFGTSITSIFRFLQLLCEGHYLNAQRALIAQPHAIVSANLVESTTSFLLDTYLALTDMDMGLITQLFETITEYCQGPCVEAQETVANYKFISAVNALLTHSFEQRDKRTELEVHRLRAAIVVTLLSLLEGRSDRVLHTQLVQELNFEALKMNLVEVYAYFVAKHRAYAGNSKCSQDFYLTMGFNIYILLQQLADQHKQAWWIPLPAGERKLHENQTWQSSQSVRRHVKSNIIADNDGSSFDYRDAFRFFQSNCAKVEVLWDHHRFSAAKTTERITVRTSIEGGKTEGTLTNNGNGRDTDDISSDNTGALIPFYFPVHPICFCLTDKSKKKLVWNVSRGTDKLSDFYARSDKLVDEMTHQSHLQLHKHVSWVAKNLEEIKRVAFILAVIINLIVLLFYRAAGIYSTPFPANEITFIHAWDQEMEPPKPSLGIDVALTLAGTLQIILYIMVLLCYMLNSAPLLIKKGWKRRHRKEQAKHSKRSASVHHRLVESKERESFQDTEQLLRSLRECEEEYNYLFLPSSVRKPTRRNPVSPRIISPTSSFDASSAKHTRSSEVQNGIGASRRNLRDQLETVGISLYFLVRSPRVIYSLFQIFISVLGAYVSKLYFAFLLLDAVDRYKELNNVLRSISRSSKALSVTTLLYLIVVYVFAVVGFSFFREDYSNSETMNLTAAQIDGRAPYNCQRLFQCFLVSLDQGLKSDGGLGTFLEQLHVGESAHSYGRLAFDVLFNIILVVLLLNLVFGVIIDMFASLRAEDEEKILDMRDRCFICSIDAYTFDRATKRGFHDHISRDHNMWHYLYLFVHIRKKTITEYNGLELFLAMRMAKKDMSFFPTHHALSLTKHGYMDDNHEVEISINDDRFYTASSIYAPRRYRVTPFTPSRSSLVSKATSSHRSSDHLEVLQHTNRNSSINFRSSHPTHHDVAALPATIDRATAMKLERIESTIYALATEMKDAQRQAEEKYSELLASILRWQQSSPLPPISSPSTPTMSAPSTARSPPALSRYPSIRALGSVTPRIFNFESVTDDTQEENESLRTRDSRRISAASTLNIPSLTAPVTPRNLNIDSKTSVLDSGDREPGFLDEGQDWFSASPEHVPAPSPLNAARLQRGISLTYHMPPTSDDVTSEYSASPDLLTLAQITPSYKDADVEEGRPLQPPPVPGTLTPRVFSFEYISDEEELKEESSKHQRTSPK